MTTRVTKRRSQNAIANITESLAPIIRREAALRGSGVHSLATEMMTLLIECMQATGTSWEEYRKTMPGYDAVIAARLDRVKG